MTLDTELCLRLRNKKKLAWEALLQQEGLTPDNNVEITCLIWDGDALVATGSRQENLLKCIAVDSAYQGQGLTATLMTALRQDAQSQGYSHLFLYTKPKNEMLFTPLFFSPVAKTEDVLLMESIKDGITQFLQGLSRAEAAGKIGCVVANCNPFTFGHRYLIETAAKQCDRLYVFVLSEDKSDFSFADRLQMVKRGTADLENVIVLPTGPYLISSATFPTYFLKENAPVDTIQCQLDCQVFAEHYAPYFGIKTRCVGTEPNCRVTASYNETMKQILPQMGIEVIEIPRKTLEEIPISASRVRQLMKEENWRALQKLVPATTYEYLQTNGFVK